MPQQESAAVEDALTVIKIERALGLFFEVPVNQFVAAHTWLAVAANYWYATTHFGVTILVGVWVLARHRRYARSLRTAWYAMNLTALVGYTLFPLAPPRLTPGHGFIDTVVVFDTWGSWGSESVASASNQYAAMPSMHAGWALWCAVVVVLLARRPWVKVVAALYPVVTLAVIVATANHYWLDAVGGAAALALGFAAARLLLGRPVLSPEPSPALIPLPRAAADDVAVPTMSR